MDFVPILTLALGFLAGLGVGAARAFALERRRRAIAGMNVEMARFWPPTLPGRTAADILAGVVRIVLGGVEYELPILPRAASRRWLASLDVRFASLINDMESAGDDADVILRRLASETTAMYELLRSYDQAGTLPPAEDIDEYVTDVEILRAVLEVWRAAHPLAATLAENGMGTSGTSPVPPSSPPSNTAGDLMSSIG